MFELSRASHSQQPLDEFQKYPTPLTNCKGPKLEKGEADLEKLGKFPLFLGQIVRNPDLENHFMTFQEGCLTLTSQVSLVLLVSQPLGEGLSQSCTSSFPNYHNTIVSRIDNFLRSDFILRKYD